MNENLGIMRFCFVCVRTIRAFVTDLDIRGPSSDSWRCSLDGGVGAPLLRGGVYSTRVEVYWPRAVCTARKPHRRGVSPNLFQ